MSSLESIGRDAPWAQLFSPPGAEPAPALRMQLLRRGGRAFLLLPEASSLAARSLELFPAQSARARAARWVFGLALGAGLRPKLEPVTLRVSRQDAFAMFLAGQGGRDPNEAVTLPDFAMLAGNPRTEGQRCIFLIFGLAGSAPAAVVKAGAGARARELMVHEEEFLTRADPRLPGIPKLRGSFSVGAVRAIKMDYCPGRPPVGERPSQLPALLDSWVMEDRSLPFSALEPLRSFPPLEGRAAQVLSRISNRPVCPVIFHGDFAPWNIREDRSGRWIVLDWERGEREGIPLWDWLHYIVQPAILVGRKPAAVVLQRLDSMLLSAPVLAYAARARISGMERDLALLYLDFCVRVLHPTEGLATLQELKERAATAWFRP